LCAVKLPSRRLGLGTGCLFSGCWHGFISLSP
jgi:hypothetical protein